MTDRKLENMMGLCRAAGGVTTGFDSVLGEVRRKRAVFVLIASDASGRTSKQLRDKCGYYNVPYFFIEKTAGELSDILGKSSVCTAAAFTGKGPCRPLLSMLEENARRNENDNENLKKNENAVMTERMIADGSEANVGD